MTPQEFSQRNLARCAAGFNHPLEAWSFADWYTATGGELGEAANIVKKMNRHRDGIPGNKETMDELRHALAEELADVYTYLDLLAQVEGVQLRPPVVRGHGPQIAGFGLGDWMQEIFIAFGDIGRPLQGPARHYHIHRTTALLHRFAGVLHIDLMEAVVAKFEKVSERIGYKA